MKVEKDPTIRLSIIRCIGELSKKNEERAKEVLKQCGIPFFMDILSTHDMNTVNASSYIIPASMLLIYVETGHSKEMTVRLLSLNFMSSTKLPVLLSSSTSSVQ